MNSFQNLLSNFKLRRYIKEGEVGTSMFILLSGSLTALAPTTSGPLDSGAGNESSASFKLGAGRGLHSSTFRLNVSAFCGIGIVFGDYLRGGAGGFRGYGGKCRVYFVSETAQIELKSGRV